MDFKIDLHVHSIASQHAYSTIEEIAKQAKDKGLKAFAITDHGCAAPDAPYRYYFSNLKVLPEKIYDVRVLRGVEANIISEEGKLDLENSDLKNLEIRLAGFHKLTGYESNSEDKNTRALIAAIKNGFVDIVAHIGQPMYKVNYKKVLEVAKEYNVAIELNNSSFLSSRLGSQKNCIEVIKIAKELGNYISLGSDSHISFDVGNLEKVTDLVNEYKIEKDLILNSDYLILDKFLKGRRK